MMVALTILCLRFMPPSPGESHRDKCKRIKQTEPIKYNDLQRCTCELKMAKAKRNGKELGTRNLGLYRFNALRYA